MLSRCLVLERRTHVAQTLLALAAQILQLRDVFLHRRQVRLGRRLERVDASAQRIDRIGERPHRTRDFDQVSTLHGIGGIGARSGAYDVLLQPIEIGLGGEETAPAHQRDD